MLDHLTIRSGDLKGTRGFFETILGLEVGYPGLHLSHPQIWSRVVPIGLLRHAPALSADSLNTDDLIAAPTEWERHARAKAARASYEFWNMGDEALLKRAFAKNFADRAVWPPRAPAPIDLRPGRRRGPPEQKSI